MSELRPLIRRARPQDRRALQSVLADIGHAREISRDDLAVRDVFVAEHLGRIVGFSAFGDEQRVHLEALVVVPDRRDRGVGSALLIHALVNASTPTVTIRCDEGAAGFFRRFEGHETRDGDRFRFDVSTAAVRRRYRNVAIAQRPWRAPYSRRPLEQVLFALVMFPSLVLLALILLVTSFPENLVMIAILGGLTALPLAVMWHRRILPTEDTQRQLEAHAAAQASEQHRERRIEAQRTQALERHAGQLALTAGEGDGAVSLAKGEGALSVPEPKPGD